MKKLSNLYFLIFCLTFATCKSQNDKDISLHYQLIDKAENHIMLNDYVSAAKTYEKSFQVNNNMFAIDSYNALLCNLYIENWEACEIWSSRLLRKGITKDFFKAKRYSKFKRTNEWLQLDAKFSKLDNDDCIYKQILDSLLVEDQRVYCAIPIGELTFEEAKASTGTIEEKFASIIEKYGFPTEEKVGIQILEDTVIAVMPRFSPLMRHSYQSGNAQLIAFFAKALKSGEMDRRVGLVNLNDDSKFIIYSGTLYRRKSLNMSDEIQLREKKLKYLNKESKKGFFIFAQYSSGNFADESSVKAFLELYDVIIPNWNGPQ